MSIIDNLFLEIIEIISNNNLFIFAYKFAINKQWTIGTGLECVNCRCLDRSDCFKGDVVRLHVFLSSIIFISE